MNKPASTLQVLLAYLCGLAVAVAVGRPLMAWWPPELYLGVADVAATLTVFVFSRTLSNSSIYDPYWSVAPPIITLWLWLHAPEGVSTLRGGLVMALVFLWGLRLTWNWYRGWGGLDHEDWRYVDLKARHGAWYWWISLSGIHLMPTLLVYLGCLSLFPIYDSAADLSGLDIAALTLMLLGIVYEGVADQQLRRFVQAGRPGGLLETGLWRHSRHPNYFGEICFWWGLGLAGLAAGGSWWVLSGAVAITALFIGISVPLIERRHLARRPGYAKRRAGVSQIIPWPIRPR